MFCDKSVRKNFANISKQHLCWSLFLTTLLKTSSSKYVFLWNLRNFSEDLFWRTTANDCFQAQKQYSRGVQQKLLFSILINAVMIYSFSAAVVQSWRSLHANLQKHSITGIFQRISPQAQNSDIGKCILMAASED